MRFTTQMTKILLVLRKNAEGLTERKIIEKSEGLANLERKHLASLKVSYRRNIKKLISRGLVTKEKNRYKLTGEGIDQAQKAYNDIKNRCREYQHLVG
ncbi:MAG: hypothetical protein ACE5K4_09625 [Candidatus Hydrothermarchaeota archaeon]